LTVAPRVGVIVVCTLHPPEVTSMRSLTFAALVAGLFLMAAGTLAQPPAKPKTDPARTKPDPKAKTKDKDKGEAKDTGERFSLEIKTADIRLGNAVLGPKLAPEDLKGRVVFVDYWGIHCAPCLAAMPHVSALHNELADFGLVVIGAHVQDGETEKVRAVALGRGATFPIQVNSRVKGGEDNRSLPHSFLFDHTGQCVFRGLPTEADGLIRKAVGAALVAAAKQEKWSPALAGIVKDLQAGKPPATILPRVAALRNSSGEAGDDAKALLAAMTAVGKKKLDEANEKKGSEPLEAYLLIEKVPTAFKGSPVATEASELLTKLKAEKAVRAELAARSALEAVKKLDQQLGLGAEDPRKPEWQKAHKEPLAQLKKKVQAMQKLWPEAKSTQQAVAIADRYAIELK
jgi:thiol-disulfide isomerase/thioredoxin